MLTISDYTVGMVYLAIHVIPYSGKVSREKTFTNFAVLEPPAKVFSSEFGRAISTYARFVHSTKVFSTK